MNKERKEWIRSEGYEKVPRSYIMHLIEIGIIRAFCEITPIVPSITINFAL